jgi:RNA recognition motif-containing protein
MSTRLFIGNVAYNLDEQGLIEGFAQLGITIENAKIAREKETHRPRGFAFIEVAEPTAEALLSQGARIGGRDLRIERSAKQPGDDVRDRRSGSGGGRPSGGGGGGGDRRRGGGGGSARDRGSDGAWGGGGGRRERRERW